MDWGCNDYVSRADVLEITAETGALETQGRVKELPAADVQLVVRGKWEERKVFTGKGNVDMIQSARCNKCGKYHTTPYLYYFTDYYFCPNCGAKMRENKEQ